jgi:hypothetical protein
MKNFVDESLKQCSTKTFSNEAEKIRYLLDALYNIRDFVLSQTNENSVRISLIKQFEQIEKSTKMGNGLEQLKPENESIEKTEEKLVPDQKNSETREEVIVESIADS